jgi:hypothetical protein
MEKVGMKKSYSFALACAAILCGVSSAPRSVAAQSQDHAGVEFIAVHQAPHVAQEGVAQDAVASTARGPIAESAAFHVVSTQSRTVADQEVGPHMNRGLAMTVAGLAAVAVGYAVKGQAGTLLALGGGALTLYGVYHWIE